MATLKHRMLRLNTEGTYDTIHLETESSVVLRPSGRTVEEDLADYLPEAQNNAETPTVTFGKFITNTERPYVGKSDNTADGLIMESDHPIIYEVSETEEGEIPPYEANADSLGGHPASDFVLNTDLTAQLANKADRVHTHQMSNVTGLDTALAGKANATHTHSADQVTAGTLPGDVVAHSGGAVGSKMIRNIYGGTTDIGAGAELATGDIYLVYE